MWENVLECKNCRRTISIHWVDLDQSAIINKMKMAVFDFAFIFPSQSISRHSFSIIYQRNFNREGEWLEIITYSCEGTSPMSRHIRDPLWRNCFHYNMGFKDPGALWLRSTKIIEDLIWPDHLTPTKRIFKNTKGVKSYHSVYEW